MAKREKDVPVVYLLHGDDEFGITQFVNTLKERMGSSANADMNTTRLNGRNFSLRKLRNTANTIPFLTSRRLVVLDQPTHQLRSKTEQEKFLSILDHLPPSTALVIIESKTLPEKNWLRSWARIVEGRAFAREFSLPKGVEELARWIRNQAQMQGGEFKSQAADLLASLVPDNNRLAVQEIGKVLTYVNFQRPVEVDDIELLTTSVAQGDVFKMVDAIGSRDGRRALRLLHQLLTEREPLSLFGMIVRQFRLLLLTSELVAKGATQTEIAKTLHLPGFVVRRLSNQTRNFSLLTLENILRRLLDIDESIKTGNMDATIALDTLIVGLTN